MRPYKDFLLVSDMDGTLLTSAKTVSEANKKAIQEFVDGGGRFAIATGRTPDNAKDYLQGVAVNAPSIFYNGSLLADLATGRVLKAAYWKGGCGGILPGPV
jgi:HAD superfamily hydrolase (TIGR01484 family)